MRNLFALLILLITACSKSIQDHSVLDKSICRLPCWNGIVAGKTTEPEFLEILGGLSDVDQASIQVNRRLLDIFDNRITFSFSQHLSVRGYAYTEQNTLSTLIICGEIDTTIERLVQEIGEPKYIISGNDIGGGRTVILIDSKDGISYWYTANLNSLEITPDIGVDCFQIFDPALFDQMLEAKIFSNGYYNAAETVKVWYPWDGYGNLDEKYPPRQP